jgi:hypothetical protein
MRTHRLSRWGLVALAAIMITGLGSGGCRVSQDDIHKWEGTERGPEKLVAVITHDKYEPALRIEAALALVRMKPRGGRRVGVPTMVSAIAAIKSAEDRNAIIGGIVPVLVQEMGKQPPIPQAGQPMPPDGSIPYKDAAYALLTYDKAVLVTDDQHKQQLVDALAKWPAADFERRYDNASQMYGVEQIIRFVGAAAARPLPPLIDANSRKIPELARLIAENGDTATKEAASKRIVEVAAYTASDKFIDTIKPVVEEANRTAKLNPTPDQLKYQLTAAQDEQLKKIFGAMKKLGGRPVVEFCLTYAAQPANSEERRTLALAALEGNFDQQNPNDTKRILDLAAADNTPDKVRDLAFRRVGEMPRDKVVARLYEIFSNKRWQIRWVAAQYVIKMSDTTQIPEIMARLPGGSAENFAMTEALSYGDWMGNKSNMPEKNGKTARAQLEPFLKDSSVARRTTALGWFYAHGTAQDLGLLGSFENDSMRTPKCDDKQTDCEWKCYVPKADKPDEREPKQVANVGEFVRFCIVPAIKDRKEPSKDQPKGDAPTK